MNKIGIANNPDFEELTEEKINSRKFEDIGLSPLLISEEEKEEASGIIKSRYEGKKKGTLNFTDLGASFTIELTDIIAVDEMKSGDLSKGIEVIKDSMIFAEKGEAFECFMNNLEKYSKYLENPSERDVIEETKTGLEECVNAYSENPYAHFILGLIYHRPGVFFDLEKSFAFFEESKKHSSEMEDHYMKALSGFMLSWLYYIRGESDNAIKELLEVIDEEFMRIPEVYYFLAKFYASQKDHENSLKYLDEAVTRFDYFYAFKADIDEDFSNIKEELQKYYEKLIKAEKEKVSENLKKFGINIKNNENAEDKTDPGKEN
ncbi:MAG: hypothetical protein JXN63_08095 [Candidatus Delongbacteria bacterium]|nr:hypothetical protein [Candidatus Delongbacteria bacterium]